MADRDAWRVMQRSTTTGGADDTVELDSRGRPIRWWWHGPSPPRDTGEPPRLMQELAYDALGENIARRSVRIPLHSSTRSGAPGHDRSAATGG
jgi:hypothetical protein